MNEHITKTEYHLWFDSMEEMKACVPSKVGRGGNQHIWHTQVAHTHRGYRWYGCSSSSEAMRRLNEGWPELLNDLNPMVSALRADINLDEVEYAQVQVRRRKRHRADYGDTLDMNRVWSGHLDTAWDRPVKENRMVASQKYATIFADLSTFSYVRAESTMWRAATIVFAIDMMTRMGLSTEIWAGNSVTDTYETFSAPRHNWYGVKMKEFTQPMTDERVACACHVAMLRTYIFGMQMCAPWRADSGLGTPVQTGLVKPLRDRQSSGERVFRVGAVYDQHTARNEVLEIMKQLNKKEEAA